MTTTLQWLVYNAEGRLIATACNAHIALDFITARRTGGVVGDYYRQAEPPQAETSPETPLAKSIKGS